jgi:two-component system chemotaxis sensor kinase CheA
MEAGEGHATDEIVVIERGDRRAGLVVDELLGQEDIVVKAFDAAQGGLTLFSGATILADGAPALIVDVGSLL